MNFLKFPGDRRKIVEQLQCKKYKQHSVSDRVPLGVPCKLQFELAYASSTMLAGLYQMKSRNFKQQKFEIPTRALKFGTILTPPNQIKQEMTP